MSRCFPYPPPGYTLSRASNEALIESIKSIKLQKERENAKAERKKEKKKRENDEKKKLKKEKAKLNTFGHDACGAKSWKDSKCGYLQKELKDETEQLERSSITEEYGLPQNPSCSSDSTQNSNKRKRHTSGPSGTCAQGNILRIRLPSQKIADGQKQPCSSSTSGRRDTSDTIASRSEPDKTCSTSAATASVAQSLAFRLDNESRELNRTLFSSQENINSKHGSKRYKKMQRAVKKYTDLVENWIPPSQQVPCSDADDQDWLFGRKHKKVHIRPDKNSGVINQTSCSSRASLWPSAKYLPGADIYCLPYTIPF